MLLTPTTETTFLRGFTLFSQNKEASMEELKPRGFIPRVKQEGA